MFRSLKLRLALLTAVITASIIVLGGVFMIRNIQASQLARIDEEIKRLSITNLPKLFESRSPRDRERPRLGPRLGPGQSPRPEPRPRPGPPPEALEITPGFWVAIVRPDDKTFFSTEAIPAEWFSFFPTDSNESSKQFQDSPRRIPLGRIFSDPERPLLRERGRENIPEQLANNLTFRTQRFGDTVFRIGRIKTPQDFHVYFGRDLTEHLEAMKEIRRSTVATIPLFTVITILFSAFLSARALSPIKKLSQKLDTVSAGELDSRLDDTNLPTEFTPLTHSINDMLERLERSFHQANRFTADASHELRTPLTILKGHLEKLIQNEPDALENRQQEYVNLLDEVDRLQRLSSQLLFLARSDSGSFEIKPNPVEVFQHTEEIVEDFKELYPEFSFELSGNTGPNYSLDWPIIQQGLVNLLINAVKYNDDSRKVSIYIKHTDSALVIQVANTGPPISEKVAPELFKRFYRGEKSRDRSLGSGGTGLGLSIAQECIHAHGGQLSYAGFIDGKNVFQMEIPVKR